MSKYIERQKALDTVFRSHSVEGAHRFLVAIKPADVRPVVTCADCKYNKRKVTDLWGNDAIQCITGQTHRHDWFCADGKKREES